MDPIWTLSAAALSVSLHLAFCLGATGIAWRSLLRPLFSSSRADDWAIECLALGSIWSIVQLVVLVSWRRSAGIGTSSLLAVKYGSDLLILLSGWAGRSAVLAEVRTNLTQLGFRARQGWNAFGLFAALAFGTFALVHFPFAGDNQALYWTATAVADATSGFSRTQGSFGYLGWLFWPALWNWPEIAPSTLGAAAKLPLNLLAYVAVQRLCRLSPWTAKPWVPPVLYFLTLGTFLGGYGLLETGKETPYGILFLFAAMASLLEDPPEHDGRPPGYGFASWLALAIGFGAIAVPYGAVFVGLHLLAGGGRRHGPAFFVRVLVFCSIPLVTSIVSMTHVSAWLASTSMLLAIGALEMIARFRRSAPAAAPPSARFQRAREIALFSLSVGGAALLLPVHFAPTARPPLDGTTDFEQLFLTSHHFFFAPPYLGYLAFAGMAVTLLHRGHQGGRCGLGALVSFPFAVLVPTLLVARWQEFPLPFHPQHLWDLAKDVPNWCWGVLASFFALLPLLLMADAGTRLLSCRGPRLARWARVGSAVTLGGLLVSHALYISRQGRLAAFWKLDRGAVFSSVGGHRDPRIAYFGEALVHRLAQSRIVAAGCIVHVDSQVPSAHLYWDLHGFGARSCLPRRSAVDIAFAADSSRAPVFLVTRRERLEDGARVPEGRVAEELVAFPGDSSLFEIRAAEGSIRRFLPLTVPPFALQAPRWAELFRARPRAIWQDEPLPRGRDGDGQERLLRVLRATLWVAADDLSGPRSILSIEVGFGRREQRTLHIRSPAMSRTVEVDRGLPTAALELDLTRSGATGRFYNRAWVPLEFELVGRRPRPAVRRQRGALGFRLVALETLGSAAVR